MNELLKNEFKRQMMGKHAAEQAADRFSVESTAKDYEELYEKALTNRSAHNGI